MVVFAVPADRAADHDGADTEVPLTVMINPEIEPLTEDRELGWEACLSLPGLAGRVRRYTHIRYRYLTPDGESVTREAEDYHARVVQHECDHLDGVLYPMRMDDMSRFGFVEEINAAAERARRAEAASQAKAAARAEAAEPAESPDRVERPMTSRPTSSGDAADQPRGELLDALLSHVPFDGWTRRAVDRAAADIGRTPFDAHRAFPGGVAQIIDYHSARADRDMTQALAAVDMIPMRIRDRITLAVRTRLEQNTADREAIRRAVAYLALPFHAGLASRCLYRTVDAMWVRRR